VAAGDKLEGARLPDAVMGKPGPGWKAWKGEDPYGKPAPGAYMKVTSEGPVVYWYICDPTGHQGTIVTGSPTHDNHTVTEHEDGTITVSPSILATEAEHGHDWHGYLEQGVWREA
jgi:uncharacterized protein YndB with AHSA1/START domain